MKVRFEKDITLHSALLYLKIKRKIYNQDIKSYLNNEIKYERLINARIKEYLKNIGIYDEKYSLTEKGNKVKYDGMIEKIEEGLYKIWYTENDPYIGTVIFYLRRNEPSLDNKESQHMKIKFDNINFCVKSSQNENNYSFNIMNNDFFGFKQEDTQVKVILEGDNSRPFLLKIVGKLEENIRLDAEIEWKEGIESFFVKYIDRWDNENKRYKIYFEEVKGVEEKRKFRYEKCNISIDNLGFKGEIHDLDLLPYDKENAEKWRNYLFTEEIKKDYYNRFDFNDLANEINEKIPIKFYNLSPINFKDYKKELKKGTPEYWHCFAPYDLYPAIIQYQSKIEINQNDTPIISFREIINRLEWDTIKYDYLFFYDKYALKREEKTKLFLKLVEANEKIIISLKDPNQKFSLLKDTNFKIYDINQTINQSIDKTAHDRYIILVKNNDLIAWVCTNSLDYIWFDRDSKNITEDTKGKLVQNVVYIRVSKNQIPTNLLTFIEKVIKKEEKYAI